MVKKIRVLIVDDSLFFRKRIRQELERAGQIEIIGEASNGQDAVDLAARLDPDLITMDVAMPKMDGIAAVREIMRARPTSIIMFSALTREGAAATLDALDAGAVDFMSKEQGLANALGESLTARIIHLTEKRPVRGSPATVTKTSTAPSQTTANEGGKAPRLVLIGASTGGPMAVQRVLDKLLKSCPYPVIVAVHMPQEFTATFADRLDRSCALDIRLAKDRDALEPGVVLLAPGGSQTLVESSGGKLQVRVMQGGDQLYKPSVDILFGSAARSLGADCIGVVLTGMGSDGTDGARLLKDRGASIWAQDQQSSVVYGMPHAVVKAGFTDRVLPLDEIGPALGRLN